MSKKQRRMQREQKKTLSTPVFILMFGGALLVAAAIMFGVQRFGGDGGGAPVLTVDQEVIQYGDVKFNVPLTFEIKVTNTGDGTLRFKEEPYIEVREGC